MIQLRLGQQALVADIKSLRSEREADRTLMVQNHAANRESIHKLRNDLQTVAETVGDVSKKIDDYLLVQTDRDLQSAKAWWKQPLGTALIVTAITVGWAIVEHGIGWAK